MVLEGRHAISCVRVCDFGLRRKSHGKCSFLRSGASFFARVVVLCTRLVKNARSNFNICERLAQFARFGAPDSPFPWKFQRKRSFWASGRSVFEEVSQKMLVLEVRIFSFRGSLSENARFGSLDLQFLRMSRRICSFWKSGSSFRWGRAENAPFRSLDLHLWWKPCTKRAFWKRNVTTVTPLQECYPRHRFKNVSAVTASRILPQSLLQECYRSHRVKNVTAVTASWM